MKWLIFVIGLAVQLSSSGFSQGVVLYQETFPYPGFDGEDFPISMVGWVNDIPDFNYRLYQSSGDDGAVLDYEGASATTAFYTSTALTRSVGAAFPTINPSLYNGITFFVDIQPYYDPTNVTARFAVQMNNNSWFVSTNVLPLPATAGPYATYSNVFTPYGSQWDSLFVSGDGTGTNATIGSVITSNLVGNITGAGLVFVHTLTGGELSFDNFLVEADSIGNLAINVISNGIGLNWPAAINLHLQTATTIDGPWNNLPDLGTNFVVAGTTNDTSAFFRLSAFAIGGLQDGDFESGDLSNNWQNSGNTGAASLESGGAFSGTYYLQQSNSNPYQVQTFQLVTNLPDGYYKLTAMVENSGGQSWCYISGNDKITSLPISSQWTNTIVRGIYVTNGQCLISICSDDPIGGNWCRVDFIQLIKDDIPYNLLKGGDISELTYVEQGGGKFYETNGVQEDCLQILQNHGWNFVRLRLYNNPGNPNWYPSKLLPPGIQSPTNILALAARAKARGMKIELTINYSDYWADEATQYKPHGWEGLSQSGLISAVSAFTRNIMTQMANQGTPPDYVSLGNQIDYGILLENSTPAGSPPNPTSTNAPVNGSTTNFAFLAQLLNAGYAAVKSISPSTQVIIHSANLAASEYFFSQCVTNGVHWDVTGCSFYPYWSGLTAEQARDQINQLIYWGSNKPVLIMETGCDWSTNCCDGYTGQLANNGPEPFPSTSLGQKEFLLNCFNAIKMVNNGACIGDLYWDPIFICVPGEGWELGQRNVVDNTTLFDFGGHVLPSLDAFQFNN
jgi:arabinogalactan endo-1,4-beta-galactosidase